MRARGISTIAVGGLLALVLGGCAATEEPLGESGVGVQLFQLPWASIADECEQNLGPAGFDWVLTSPPQEHITGDAWWIQYQPVSYRIESSLGTREEFADMVSRCDDAGVAIIADAVINHMTGQDAPGVGVAGSEYQHHEYPGIYTAADFHRCGLTANDDIEDYRDRAQVQTCELVNLADLDTSSPSVRATIVAYLEDLLSLGVDGFRIDAAKHMAAEDVAAIVGELPEGTRILSEVIRGAMEPVQPEEYTGFGEVFEFTYARDLSPQLQSGILVDPDLSDERPMHVPSDRAIVFVDNHDTERGEADVTFRDPQRYAMANVLMLADDYGTPVVMSGYAFDDREAGPPKDGSGLVLQHVCESDSGGAVDAIAAGERTCTQTWPAITGMVEFRAAVRDAPRLPGAWEGDAYGFERDARGVVAVNPSDVEVTISVPTTMPAGVYCDVVASGASMGEDSACAASVTVADGVATFTLAPGQSSAIHVQRTA